LNGEEWGESPNFVLVRKYKSTHRLEL